MQAQDVITQLYTCMPRFNSNFSVLLSDFSIGVAGTTVTVTTTSPHGLTTGNAVVAANMPTKTEIATFDLDDLNDILTITTVTNHDLTEEFFDTVEIVDSTNANLNGTFELLTVPNRRTFTVRFTGTDISSPGTANLLENRSFGSINGTYQITVVDTTNFTYEIPFASSDTEADKGTISTGIRISGGSDIERITENYTLQTQNEDLWGFVVTESSISNKDRNVTNDATLNQGGLNDWNVLYLETFTFYVFVPTDNDITGRRAKDLCDKIKPDIYNCVLGVEFPSGFSSDNVSPIYPLGDEFFGYFGAYYIHSYRFEQISRITTADITNYDANVSFRDIDFSITDVIEGSSDIEFSGSVDLDDEPL